jgi:transposase-like protein
MDATETNLSTLSRMTEEEARAFLESVRWPNGPVCSHCQGTVSTKLQGKSTRPGVYKCKSKACRKPFTVTTGTIFERSHVDMRTWVLSFHLMCSAKKGLSAHQLMRQLGIKTYQTAWFICHRVRWAMTQEPLASLLSGTVEVDEAWVGGKPRNKRRYKRGQPGVSFPTTQKVPVVALIQRDGEARALRVADVRRNTLESVIRQHIDVKNSTLMTDERPGYVRIGRQFGGGHGTTNHSVREYLKPGGIHSNTAESFFALFRRRFHGSHHHMSAKHLPRYLAEATFTWNHRKVSDGERTIAALKATTGKRLTYRQTANS